MSSMPLILDCIYALEKNYATQIFRPQPRVAIEFA